MTAADKILFFKFFMYTKDSTCVRAESGYSKQLQYKEELRLALELNDISTKSVKVWQDQR